MKLSEVSRGRDNNIPLLRLLAAVFVLIAHGYDLTLGQSAAGPVSGFLKEYLHHPTGLGGVGVSIFFVISGFLITASYLGRMSLVAYLEARVLRIFPALIFAVLFSALVIGPIFTTLSTGDYLRDSGTISYMAWNSTMYAFDVLYPLPGVFESNPIPDIVNGSLWTLPVEFYMYLVVALLGLLGILKHRAIFNVFVLICVVSYIASPGNSLITLPIMLHDERHSWLAIYFIFSSFAFINAERIRLDVKTLAVLWLALIPAFYIHMPLYRMVLTTAITHLVLMISYHPRLRLPWTARFGDYSYGLYLFSFPLQQSIVALYPGIGPLPMTCWSFLTALALAVVSWHIIERPAINRKGFVARAIRGWRARNQGR